MFEKVNPMHPDKIADRIAGALVDLAYTKEEDPKIAVEVLIGHGDCHIIAETSTHFNNEEVKSIVRRIAGPVSVDYKEVRQDIHLSQNQEYGARCGDNGIFKGLPITEEEKTLSSIAKFIYSKYPTDGKYILDKSKLIICQSNANRLNLMIHYPMAIINPLGDWSGGTDVDTGATNRKLGSDMGGSVTGGGLHGKDLSKADVSINILCHLFANRYNSEVSASCAIGDNVVVFHLKDKENNLSNLCIEYADVVAEAKEYIKELGGFEKFAEWGLI